MHHSDLCTAPVLSCNYNPVIQPAALITTALAELCSSSSSSFPGKQIMLLGSTHLLLLGFFALCLCWGFFVWLFWGAFLLGFFFLNKHQTLRKPQCLLRLLALHTFHSALLKGLSVCPTLKITQEKLQRSYTPFVSGNGLCAHITCQ